MTQPMRRRDPHQGTLRIIHHLAEPPLIAVKEIEEQLPEITKLR